MKLGAKGRQNQACAALIFRDETARRWQKQFMRLQGPFGFRTKFNHPGPAGAAVGKLIVVVAFIALLALTALLYADRQSSRAEMQRLKAGTAELEVLRNQQAEFENLRVQGEQLERLKADNQELVKLRGEIAALRPLQAHAQKLTTENAQLKAEIQWLRGRLLAAVNTLVRDLAEFEAPG